ncbi:MAG TPA: alkaline phosphatase [Bacteroidales bacterium]|nr:alkaline phosphatase [Bacteroidales bacterium]
MRALIYILIGIISIGVSPAYGQNPKAENTNSSYQNTSFYEVSSFNRKFSRKKPKNIILLIGDGMSISQIYAGMTANKGNLYLNNFKHIGFSRTYSANRYVTDSGAGGTAIATGHKTNNSAIGVDSANKPVPSILEIAQANRLATGIVVTTNILDATPAAFVAHVPNRNMMPDIAVDFAETGPDVFIGGGIDYFKKRKDGRNLLSELLAKGYQVCDTLTELVKIRSGKLAGFLTENRVNKRGDQLPVTTGVALDILDDHKKGFFLMIEGSEIDGGGHSNDIAYTVEEMLDFDRAVGKALEFAAKDGKTLVVVTADHETGGLTLVDGDLSTGKITGRYSTTGHTGLMVPVFAYGPGAEVFGGIDENTSFFNKFIRLLKLKH